jgi:hypothetical protein
VAAGKKRRVRAKETDTIMNLADEADELLKWQKIVLNFWESTFGRQAQERDLADAQRELSYLEAMAEKQRSRCQEPARCDNHRCRRRRRCGRLEKVAAMAAAARAGVAARRARLEREFPALPAPSSPPAVRHGKRTRTRA